MLPTDPWHEQQAAERAALIKRLELAYEGCSAHGKDYLMGDTGEEKKRVIMEPIEVPSTVPAEPEPVPA